MMFSCSESEPEIKKNDTDEMVGWMHLMKIFDKKDVHLTVQTGDSLVLKARYPFNIYDLQYEDFGGPTLNSDRNDSNFEYQTFKLDWLTLIHPADSTLILKVDSSAGNRPIQIYTKLIAPARDSDGVHNVSDNNIITVTRTSVKSK